MEIPDSVYLLLNKGSTFNVSREYSKTDIEQDVTEFKRKLGVSVERHHKTVDEHKDSCTYTTSQSPFPYQESIPQSIKPPYKDISTFSHKPLSTFLDDLDNFTKEIVVKKPENNLTYLERTGAQWCRKQIKDQKLYISQADKGGAILLLDPSKVHNIIKTELCDTNKYVKLPKDPSKEFEKNLKRTTLAWTKNDTMTPGERRAISGYGGEKDTKSHHPAYKVQKPSPIPSFKLHKLSNDDILQKVIPPIRFISSSRFGPTYRLGKWIDSILTPLSIKYCDEEYIRDSTHFLQKLNSVNEEILTHSIFSLDIKAMYPSLIKEVVLEAVTHVLSLHRDEIPEARADVIKSSVELCIDNAYLFYRDEWFQSLIGIPTGGPESSSLANITLRYLILKYKQSHEYLTMFSQYINNINRFLDDIFGNWTGTKDQFFVFINHLNKFMSNYGIVFDMGSTQFGKLVNFLDVVVDISSGYLVTDMYIKPTDSPNLLNRGSFAPSHLFTSVPYTQYRRASLICSTTELRDKQYQRITDKLVNNGYSIEELVVSQERAKSLDRCKILQITNSQQSVNVIQNNEQNVTVSLSFVTKYNFHAKLFRSFFTNKKIVIENLIGPHRIIMALKKNPNIGDSLFSKKKFAATRVRSSSLSPCRSNCKTCPLLSLENKITLEGRVFSLFTEGSCKSEDVIYVCVCKSCDDFYIGQTITPLNLRMNNHRGAFFDGKPEKSALALHIHKDHPSMVNNHTNNYKVGILAQVNPLSLTKTEDRFIKNTEADKLHLNRYKPLRDL